MDGLRFNALFIIISFIAGLFDGDNERIFAMKSRLRKEWISPPADREPGTARSAGHHLNY